MKRNITRLGLLILIILFASLSACAQTAPNQPEADMRLLLNAFQNYSVQFPPEYDLAILSASNAVIFQETLNNPEATRVDINAMPTSSLTTETAAVEYIATYPNYDLTRSNITIDGEPAVRLDGVPSPSSLTRIVMIVHNGILYKFNFTPADPKKGDAFQAMEELYSLVIQSFNFEPES